MIKNYTLGALAFFIITISIFAFNIKVNPDFKQNLIAINFANELPALSATISGTTQACKDATNKPEITFEGFDGVAPYEFTYKLNDGVNETITTSGTNTIANLTVITISKGTFVYTLVSVEDKSGTITNLNDSATVTITKPNVGFSFNNNACAGTPVNFVSNATGSAPFTYYWDFGDGKTSTVANPSHKFDVLGCGSKQMDVKLTVTDANGCSNSTTKSVTVREKPKLEFNDMDNPYSPFNNCGNNSTNSSYTIKVGIADVSPCINSYNVDWGDGSPTETNVTFPASHTYNKLGSFNMKITGIGSHCNNTKTYLIKNSSNPTGALINPGNTVNLCTPVKAIEFAITAWGNNPPDTSYEIDYGDGTTINYTQSQLKASSYFNSADPESSANFPIPHIYTETSCPSKYTVLLDIKTSCGETNLTAGPIVILKKPEVAFEAPAISCVNTSVTFKNTSLNGYSNGCNINDGYFWDFGDGTKSSLRNPNHTFTTPGTYTVSLYAENSCGKTDIVTKTICIEPALAPSFTLNTNNGCAPLDVQTTNTTAISSNCSSENYLWSVVYTPSFCGTSPSWSFTNGTDEKSKNPSIKFTNPGTYKLTQKTTNSCGSRSVSETIEVKKPATAAINKIPDVCGTASFNPVATVASCAPSTEAVTYSWSFPGGNPATANTLDPGTIIYNTAGDYQVSFSIATSCGTTTATERFKVNPIPTITNTNLTQTICSGTSTTEIVLNSDVLNTSYSWKATGDSGISGFTTSGSTNTIPVQTIFNSNNTFGIVTYTVTPTTNGCDGNPVDIVITIDPAPTFTNQPQAESICLNGVLNPLSVNVAGTGTPIYQWYSNTMDNTTSGSIITGATASTYTPLNDAVGVLYYYCVVSFSSGNGCSEIISNTARIEIVKGIQIDSQPAITQNLCVDGAINTPLSVIYSGGTGAVNFQWFSNTTNTNTGGTIIVGATNRDYTPPTFNTSGNYYYYAVISPAGSGCGDITTTTAEIVVVNAPIISNQPLVSQELCQGSLPQNLEVSASGGTGSAYTYQWYANTTNSNTGGALISEATNTIFSPPTTATGSLYYYCVVTQPDPGCSVTSNTSLVIINASPIITAQPISETVCFGSTPKTLSVAVANGVGAPTYQWYSNTVDVVLSGTVLTGETKATYNPPATTIGTLYYYCIVTFSAGGCTEITSNTAEITINQTPNISSKTETICSGASFQITPDSSTGDLVPASTLYTWPTPTISPAGTITGASSQNTPQPNISQVLTNHTTSPATVSYTVTPITASCAGTNFTVTVTVNPSISITKNRIDSDCYLANNGSISISITGGVPFTTGDPYQISWTGPNGFTSTNKDISNLAPGDYTVTIDDEGGCPFTEDFKVLEPDALVFSTVNFDPETISCFGANNGSIDINISGGTKPYIYNWTKNGNPFDTSEDLSNLSEGDYQITVTDANNCTPITQSFSIIEPAKLQTTLKDQTDIVCFGDASGAINIDVIGGRPLEVSAGVFNYIYAWNGPNGFTSTSQNITGLIAGTYNLTVTDKSGCKDTLQVVLNQSDEIIIDTTATEIECYGDNNASITIDKISGGNPPYTINWSNLGSGYAQNNLSAGTYIITVTDNTNCIKTARVTIDEAPIFTINPIVKNVSCFGENDASIHLNLIGGISPISLIWDDDASAGLERNNISPGTYSVTITDGTPCVITKTFIITEPNPLAISGTTSDALDCDSSNSGAINATITGGTLPLSYSWSNGANTEDLINTPPGDYTLTVTDANGCTISDSWTINRFDPLEISVETITDFDCDTRYVNQSFVAHITGGIPPYQINWSSGIISGLNNEIMNTSQDGLVVLSVTDSFGCTTNFSYNVKIPVLGEADFATNSIGFSTYGFNSVEDPIQFTNTSTGDYISVSWDFGDGNFSDEENPAHTYLATGTYQITQTVTYAFGCVYQKTSTLVIEKGYTLIIPNAFTPNNDGLNDFFNPSFIALSNMRLDIYNTWGNLIYSEAGENIKGWNGKINNSDAENGNYYYKFSGNTFYNKTITAEGAFALIK